MVLFMLNSEGDSEDCTKSKGFCNKIDLEPIDHINYVHGAFVGERSSRPESFGQFGMQYIPHTAVLDKKARFLGNKVDAGGAVNTALQKKSSGVRCPKHHVLEPAERPNCVCDVCGQSAPAGSVWSTCGNCDYDMCESCYKEAEEKLPKRS